MPPLGLTRGRHVDSLASPVPGEATSVSLSFGDHLLTLPGRVVYVDLDMGFAVEFDRLGDVETATLQRLLAQLALGRSAASVRTSAASAPSQGVPDAQDGHPAAGRSSAPAGQ
jgi:hypothetical protein